MPNTMTRREILGAGIGWGAALTTAAPLSQANAESSTPADTPFAVSLNTSTLRGQKLPLTDLIDLAARTGYQGIEPWMDEINRHVESGGNLKDIHQRIKDRGLKVTGAIAFFEWMVDDAAKREKALEQIKRWMDQLAQIGGTHIAAPPCGDVKNVDLLRAAERYRAVLKVGDTTGVIPAVEIWGWAQNITRLGQAMLVALEADHPKACILPDVYHLYKGGSGLSGISRLNPNVLAGFHLNDYPATPPRETIADKDRVYPGDGIAPLKTLIRDLKAIGYRGPLSVELFNPDLWKDDPAVVAQTALEKTRRVLQTAATGA